MARQVLAEQVRVLGGILAESVKIDELAVLDVFLGLAVAVLGRGERRIARVVEAAAVAFPNHAAAERTLDVGNDVRESLARGQVEEVERADLASFRRDGNRDHFVVRRDLIEIDNRRFLAGHFRRIDDGLFRIGIVG